MFNLFKPNEEKSASRKSFSKMQQLLIDAEQYADQGHKDVAKSLLHQLVIEAERNTDRIAEELYAPIKPTCIQQTGRGSNPEPTELRDFADTVQVSADQFEFGRIVHESILENGPDLGKALSKRPEVVGATATDTGYDIKPKEWGNPEASWPNYETAKAMAKAVVTEVRSTFDIDRRKIESGECISDRGVDHCGRCVDHCEASDFRSNKGLTMMGGSGNE